MSKAAYTLKKHKDTKELHLFKGSFKEDGGCTSSAKSICQAMDKSDSSGNRFSCADENEAREECAEIGRKVCANCVKDLYTTYS